MEGKSANQHLALVNIILCRHFTGKFKFRGCAIKFRLCSEVIILYHRDILLEATSSQKVRATKVSSGDQGGELTLSH